jgi:hypothetical protein
MVRTSYYDYVCKIFDVGDCAERTTGIAIAKPWDVAAFDRPPNAGLQRRRWQVCTSRRATAHDSVIKNRQLPGRASGVRCEPCWADGLTLYACYFLFQRHLVVLSVND